MEHAGNSAASPSGPTDWHSIDWKHVMLFVGRAQMRIAQAELEKDFRRVKRLQRSLIRSWQAKALAVRRVTENQGKRSSGVDGELWDTPQKKWKAVDRLNQPGYRARPLRRVFIPKANGKKRPLGIPTMLDRAMQALHLLALEPVAECAADPNSYGFRKSRSTHDARQQLFISLSQKASAQWVLDADIEGFFDHINHDWLLANVHMDKRALKKWLKSGVVDRGQLHRTEEGTPQGGIISPVLANITLDGMERSLLSFLRTTLGATRAASAKVNLVRYADDFVVTCGSKELLETAVQPWIESFLRERGLMLSTAKTRIVHIDEGFDFLGWNFRKYSGKLLIKPNRRNVQAFYRKVREIIAGSLSKDLKETLIKRLNLSLRGWAQYHKGTAAKATFSKLDHLIFWRLMRWGRRTHPRKTAKWVFTHHWQRVGDRNEFVANTTDRWDRPVQLRLYRLADTPIVRHVKVKGDFNPFDPADLAYGERLRVQRMSKDIWDSQRRKLWLDQWGNCAHCEQAIDLDCEKDEDHHLIPIELGGSDALSNRVLLHKVCHTRVHALCLKVIKPVPSTRGL